VPTRVAVLQARHAAAKMAATAAAKPAKQAKGAKPVGLPSTGPTDGVLTEAADTAAAQAATAQELNREATVATAHTVPRQPSKVTVPGLTAIGAVTGGKVVVEGKIRVVEIRPVERNSVLAVEINDSTGNLTAMFYGRSHISGLICGARIRLTGSVGIRGGQPVMINPAYELISPGE